ncbi:hypothetical protein ACCS73_34205, partial [Rhizobium brockwellii]|uniref:hypothetical protein n=1 Tax=Rhizobium brockwellii TaxID=3019932 RepID=UPI003F962874
GGSIIEAEIHLAKRPKLFRQTEPPLTGPFLVRVFRCIFQAGKGTEDDESIAVFGRTEGVHFEAG